ncbi:MAG: hypothetical protein ACYC3W_11185 [Candidatus Nanopelagicales bacterium]
MDLIDPVMFASTLDVFTDGFEFEEFAQVFLSQVIGYEFLPHGGIKDRGIDGLETVLMKKGREKDIYQASIQKDYISKIDDTVKKIGKIKYDRLFYVTNQEIRDKEALQEKYYEEKNVNLTIYDKKWFVININHSDGTINAFHIYIKSHLIGYGLPGSSFKLLNVEKDPRLFVFLRQQVDNDGTNSDILRELIRSLILYSLENTDPDKNRVCTKEEIIIFINEKYMQNPDSYAQILDELLETMIKKPREIQFHGKLSGYCLPYETREKIKLRNTEDVSIYNEFKDSLHRRVLLKGGTKSRQDQLESIINQVFHKVFYTQGLEFADFVLNASNHAAFEKDLPEIISGLVFDHRINPKEVSSIVEDCQIIIREIVYRGNTGEKIYISKLAKTYLMMFLLRLDPKVSGFFSSLAGKMNVYVCTSILIPAMSEYFLEKYNQRHANLLKGATKCGVKLYVNEIIIDELATHIKSSYYNYISNYKDNEDIFVEDEMQLMYIDEILVRAYFYAKKDKKINDFVSFIDTYVSPDFSHIREDLISWLKDEYGIQYMDTKSLDLKIDNDEFQKLFEELKLHKSHPEKARNDAQMIMIIYELRKKQNENASSGIFGYQTWWLSKDTSTQRAAMKVFSEKYQVSCYIRPDFLFNYISFLPSKSEVDDLYKSVFPTLLGVNISNHLPKELNEYIHQKIAEYRTKNPARLKSVLRDLSEKIRAESGFARKDKIVSFFEKRKDELLSTTKIT